MLEAARQKRWTHAVATVAPTWANQRIDGSKLKCSPSSGKAGGIRSADARKTTNMPVFGRFGFGTPEGLQTPSGTHPPPTDK